MTATIDGTTAEDAARRDALVERLFEATLGAWDVLGVYIGDRLGPYRALADRASASTSEEHVLPGRGAPLRPTRERST